LPVASLKVCLQLVDILAAGGIPCERRTSAPRQQIRQKCQMIQLTRLNKKPLVVNSDLIEFIENAPDTVITLVTGEKVVVLESAEQIVELIIRFRQRLLPTSLATLPPMVALSTTSDAAGETE
jgi:flagellar protein FlbD